MDEAQSLSDSPETVSVNNKSFSVLTRVVPDRGLSKARHMCGVSFEKSTEKLSSLPRTFSAFILCGCHQAPPLELALFASVRASVRPELVIDLHGLHKEGREKLTEENVTLARLEFRADNKEGPGTH